MVAASRSTGVDVLTGEGLADALAGADALVDVTNSPSFEDDPVMEFFTASTTNLVAAAKDAGVGHYVVLSIVGVDGLPDERLHARQGRPGEDWSPNPGCRTRSCGRRSSPSSPTPSRRSMTVGDEVRVPDALIQPVAADDVAADVARAASASR